MWLGCVTIWTLGTQPEVAGLTLGKMIITDGWLSADRQIITKVNSAFHPSRISKSSTGLLG